jgi:hypothetical protein
MRQYPVHPLGVSPDRPVVAVACAEPHDAAVADLSGTERVGVGGGGVGVRISEWYLALDGILCGAACDSYLRVDGY